MHKLETWPLEFTETVAPHVLRNTIKSTARRLSNFGAFLVSLRHLPSVHRPVEMN